MEVLLVLVNGFFMLLAFYLGKHDKEDLNPIRYRENVQDKVEEHKEKVIEREYKKEQEAQEKAEIYNIDHYDGTSIGQKDIWY